MNVRALVNNMKNKMRENQTKRAERAAQSLKELRDERIRLEGQKKVYDLQAQEKAKLSAAKKDVMKQRFQASSLGSAALGIKKAIDKNKKTKNKKKKVGAPSFLPSGKDHPMFRK